MKAMVEPLPLVPATWITGGNCRSGWPSAARMRHIRSSVRSISLGCSAVSRESVESMAVMAFNHESPLSPLLSKGAQVIAERHIRGGDNVTAGSSADRYRQALGRSLGHSLGQDPAQIGERRPQLTAVHHHVDHAMRLEIFGALEAL